MTIAGAFAGYDTRNRPMLGVFADSRATGSRSYSDDARKVLQLAPRACCTASGDPTPLLASHARVVSTLASEDHTRRRAGKRPLSLWHQAGVLFHEVEMYRKVHPTIGTTNLLVAGYVGGRVPALAQASYGPDRQLRFLFRASEGQVLCRTTGLPNAKEVSSEVARFSIARQDRFEALLGVLAAMARDDVRFKGVGGDISYAVAYGGVFSFPTTSAGARNDLLERFNEENHQVRKFTGGNPRASKIEIGSLRAGVEDLFYGEEPAWATNDALPVPHYLGVVGQPGIELDHVAENGLHPRERASIDFHAGGPEIAPPPKASAAALPSATDELVIISWAKPDGEQMRLSISLGANDGFQ